MQGLRERNFSLPILADTFIPTVPLEMGVTRQTSINAADLLVKRLSPISSFYYAIFWNDFRKHEC